MIKINAIGQLHPSIAVHNFNYPVTIIDNFSNFYPIIDLKEVNRRFVKPIIHRRFFKQYIKYEK